MSGDQPPPYRPYFPDGPSAPSFPSALSTRPGAFIGLPYQTFPQTYAGEGDHTYYQGHPGQVGPMPPHGALMSQPGYQGCHEGPHRGPYPPKHTVYVMERQQDQDGGSDDSCLAACSAVLCCCCLWDLLTSNH